VSIHGFIKGTGKFPIRECEIFCEFKEISGIARRRAVLHTAQAISPIDAEIAEKVHFWMETRLARVEPAPHPEHTSFYVTARRQNRAFFQFAEASASYPMSSSQAAAPIQVFERTKK
jgi:hypothetical protein